MSLTPLSQEESSKYDSDSLVYLSDTEFAYNTAVPETVIEDIKSHSMMVYGGHYKFEKGDDSPRIYLTCRGKRSGKFKLKIQNFLPYCLSKDSELLTEDGWVNISEFVDNEMHLKIATLNPKTNEVEYHYPNEYIKYKYNGKMISQCGKVNFVVTPNHRMWVCDNDNVYKFIEAAKLTKYSKFNREFNYISNVSVQDYIVPKYENIYNQVRNFAYDRWHKKVVPTIKAFPMQRKISESEKHIDIDLWLEFLGYYLSEGWLGYSKRHNKYYTLSIRQCIESTKIEMWSCLKRLPFKNGYSKNNTQVDINSIQLCEEMMKYGYDSYHKQVTPFIKSLSKDKLEILLLALFKGDGSFRNGKMKTYRTVSKQLADDVQEIAMKCGYNASSRKLKYKSMKNYIYMVTLSPKRDIIPMEYGRKQINYNDYVYCISITNNIFMMRREGYPIWIGNCYKYTDEGDFKTYLGKPCEKLVLKGQHPANVKFLREGLKSRGYPQALEADILFVRRFLIDTYDYFKPTEKINPTYAIVDIETNYPENDDIISFAINNPDGDIYYESKYDTPDKDELALSLYEKLQEFDVVLAWMGEDSFDLKIMDKAFQKIDKPPLTESVVVLDLIEISRKMHGREIRGNWSLDNAGKRLCGIAKSLDEDDMKLDVRELSEEKLQIYNIIDTIIPEVIDNHLGGLEGHVILAWSLQSMLEDMVIVAAVNDIALLRAYHRAGIVLPSREFTKGKSTKATYEAAKPDARQGVYEDIVVLDLIHAYPSAVIAGNISPETKDENGIHITPKGTRFNDGKSVFIDTLKELMVERAKIKKQLKKLNKEDTEYKKLKSIDFAIKTLVAAFSHGIFGWANSRMKDVETADAITAVVRDIISKVKETCDIIGKKWIYCHSVTPDTSLLLKDKNNNIIIKNIEDIENDYMNYMVWTDCGWTKIKKFIKHKSINDIYGISTRNGFVKVTDCHSLLDENREIIKPTQLKLGDKLYHKKFIDACNESHISEDLAWLYGLFIAEGSCGDYECPSGRKRTWAINNVDLDILHKAGKIMQNEFKLGYKIDDTIKSSGVYKLRFHCDSSGRNQFSTKDIVKLFRDVCYYGKYKKVPDFILNGNEDIAKSFLRGYNLGDGIHNPKYSKEFQSFKTNSNVLAHGLTILLDRIGLDYTINLTSNGKERKYYQIWIVTAKKHHKLKQPNEVKEIMKLENNYEYVYDLETESHHFQAGIGCMIVHNTDSAYIICKKEEAETTVNYINGIIKEFCKGYNVIPELEFKGFYKIGYIHSPARNVLVPEGIEIDDDENWEESGMDFARSETAEPIAQIEIELLKMKLKYQDEKMMNRLKEMLKELPHKTSQELALIKPLNKKVSEYGKPKLDGKIGGVPFHIKAMQKAHDDYGLELKVKEKYGILPVMTSETEGVRKKRRKRVDIAFSTDTGLPSNYLIDYEAYLKTNLFGKVNDLFGLKIKELETLALDEEVKKKLGIEII